MEKDTQNFAELLVDQNNERTASEKSEYQDRPLRSDSITESLHSIPKKE
jgi:hypothetical protein